MILASGGADITIDTNAIVTAAEANQNFSRVAKLAEKKGRVIVFKNNRPKLLVIDLDTEPQIEMTEDVKIDFVAARIQCSDEELVHAGLSVADGSTGYEELLQWVMEHRT